MVRGSRSASASHQQFKDKAKTRVDDLQGIFTHLQFARKDSRAADVAVLEEQANQMLREWKAELNDPSPASSFVEISHVSSDLSSEIRRLLQLTEEEDDATSKLADLLPPMSPKPAEQNAPAPDAGGMHGGGGTNIYQEDYYLNQELPEYRFIGADQYHNTLPTESHFSMNCLEGMTHIDYQNFNLHQELPSNEYLDFRTSGQNGGNGVPHISDVLEASPPASAFSRPKCALWDCPRPTQGTDWCQDYCSNFHTTLALHEGQPGSTPVLRPRGIDLKDGPLFAALSAKTQGKHVGIPECEGAVTQKSPWNAHDIFDLLILEGETLREWLFFDKPRRAFENGNRKQRSLPDYNGRGWHESRKQVLKEFGGLKRSYYMDPQPSDKSEWHLYEYEINNCDAWALYRLEYKLVEAKKSPKAKVTNDSLVDLQQKMGMLNAANSVDNKKSLKGRARANQKDNLKNICSSLGNSKNICSSSDVVHQENAQNVHQISNQMTPMDNNVTYGPNLPYICNVESFDNYYGT